MTSTAFDPRQHLTQPMELAGRVIAITGANRGIGKAVAMACAEAGAQVVLIGRNVGALEQVHAQIVQRCAASPLTLPEPLIAPLDLEKAIARDYDTLANALHERFGRLDGLVNNAALLGTLAPIEHADVPTWCRVLHVNLTATFALTQVLLPALRLSADASVLFTSSGVGRIGKAYWGAYAVSKFGIEGLTQVLASELETTNIRVNALNPGGTRTDMRRQAYPSDDLQKLPEPAAVMGPYLALLGPSGRGITGRSFNCQPL